MKQLCQNKHTIRFRYWNRKKYAIFYSLGKCVTIGNLKKEIADVSLGKQANVCTAFSVCSSARKEDAGEEYEEGMPPVESMLQMLRIQLPQPQVADVICLFYLNKYCLPERCAIPSSYASPASSFRAEEQTEIVIHTFASLTYKRMRTSFLFK